jgi:hypothetical protein
MRWVIAIVIAAFCSILAAAWVVSKKANPEMIDVDPVAVDQTRWNHPPTPVTSAN